MKRLLLLFLLTASSAFAQNSATGNISASSTNCTSVASSCVWEQPLPVNANISTIAITGTFSATLLVEESNNGGLTWATAATLSSAGTTTYNTNGFTDIRVRCSAFTSGSAAVTISTGLNTGLQGPPGPAGGGVSSVSSIPGQPGLTAIPVQSGLMAEYRILAGETCATLKDYSGNGNNATGFNGTAPSVNAVTGGIHGGSGGSCNLPASLNSAQTIQLFIGNTNGNTNGVLVAGNGTTTSSLIFMLTSSPNSSATQSVPDQAFTVGSRILAGWEEGGNNYAYYPRVMVEGNVDVAWDMICDANHASFDTMYINGIDQNDFPRGTGDGNSYLSQRCSQGHQTTGNYQLGGLTGANCANWTNCANMNNGNIYYAVFYNRPLNAAEIAQNSAYLKTAMAARGVTPTIFQGTPGTFTPNPILAVDGDSLSCGPCASSSPNPVSPYSTYLTLNTQGGNAWNITNMARVGFRLDLTLNPFAPQAIDPIYQPFAPSNADVIWGGTNDSTNDFIPQLSSYCQARHVVGWKCIVVSMISRTALDATKNANNALIRQLWPTFADAFADIAADVNIGADGANASATYFAGDHIHVQDVGIINDETPWIQRAINRLYGNHDFSTATVYSSAAAAAVATTAGSESTNTVTLTFAATPANCQVGNMIQVAGTTPAGYSGNWLIRTRSATQVTYFAATASMGAITVQGTGICAQTQDADQYAVLNFTGNHSLDSCVGYTGQRLYRRNINAGAVTLVPFGSETITGAGASPTSIPANTTAILESQLVSASAAGCNWVRLQ